MEETLVPRFLQGNQHHQRSLSNSSFSPFLLFDAIFPRRISDSYTKLPEEPLRLSVIKLDGSSFGIEVAKSATIAELKQAVEEAFSYMPQKGPGKISWPHVWGQFCLFYDGQKLITDTDSLRNYGIRDSNEIHFVRHVSYSYNPRRRRSKKRVVSSKHLRISLLRVNSYQQKEHYYDDESNVGDIETGMLQDHSESEVCGGTDEYKVAGFLGGWFSYNGLVNGRKTRIEGNPFVSGIVKGIFGSYTKIGNVRNECQKKHYSWTETWREDAGMISGSSALLTIRD